MKNLFYLIVVTSFFYNNCNLLLAQDFSGTHFRNGEIILYVENKEEWVKAGKSKQPAWCYYDNDPANGAKYGKLYNWYAVSDSRGLCPTGWHVPDDAEWTTLATFLGGNEAAGNKMKNAIGWLSSGNGNNSRGFNGIPGGGRNNSGVFVSIGEGSIMWSSSSSELSSDYAYIRSLQHFDGDLQRIINDKVAGCSVRCIKD